MFTQEQAQQLSDVVGSAQTTLVILPSQPTLDQTATALALASALEALGKQTSVMSPQPLSAPVSDLVSADAIHTQIGNRDLAVSFAYTPESVDKVSYHIDEQQQRFYLVIKPQKGQKPLSQDSVEFSYTGAEADIIFLIGVNSFDSLEHLYFGYEQLYQTAVTVSFNTYQGEIGTFKLDFSGTSSLSESLALMMQQVNWQLSSDAATNLLLAIEQATDHFQSLSTSAETFEVTAWLMRQGARRSRRIASREPAIMGQASQPVEMRPAMEATQGKDKHRPRKHGKQPKPLPHSQQMPVGETPAGSLKYQPSGFGPGGGG